MGGGEVAVIFHYWPLFFLAFAACLFFFLVTSLFLLINP